MVTRSQALAYGLTTHQISYRVRVGDWVRHALEDLSSGRCADDVGDGAARRLLSDRRVAAHRCAAALWQLDLYDQPPIEVLDCAGVVGIATTERLAEGAIRRGHNS